MPRGGTPKKRPSLVTLACGATTALMVPFLGIGAASAQPAPDAQQTLIASAGDFTQRVPDGVCSVDVTIAGAHGGGAALKDDPDWTADGQPGAGAVVTSHLNVQAGDVLTGTVGSNGADGGGAGQPGGGAGGAGTHQGGGGGGYSQLTVGSDLLLLAGGGGGTGGGHTTEFGFGGDAGAGQSSGVSVTDGTVFVGEDGTAGQDMDDSVQGTVTAGHPGAGKAGGATAGGAAGTHSLTAPGSNNDGTAGASLQGGNGGTNGGADHGGGGGAGYFGGGGGADTHGDVSFTDSAGTSHYIVGGGGGGGSTFVSDNTLISNPSVDRNVTGSDLGDGYAQFDWVMCEYDLSVAKSVVGPAVFEDGDTMTYRITVTNNGDDAMALGDTVTIEDDHLNGGTLTRVDGDLSEADVAVGDVHSGNQLELFDTVDLGGGVTGHRGLGAGDSVTIEYAVVITGTDPVRNTVTTFERGGDPDNNTASAVIDPARPSIDLVKEASDKKITEVGQKVTYSFIVTNTGNIALRSIAITEGSFSGKGTLPAPTCPSVTVQPGDSTTCTSVYKAVKGDLTGKSLTNTATATAATPGGTAVHSDPASVVLTTVEPALLPDTGSSVNMGLLGVAAASIGAGAIVIAGTRRHQRRID